MFGVEKFDERTQTLALLGGIVVILTVSLIIFFIATSALVTKEESPPIRQPGQSLTYVEGFIIVTYKEGVSGPDARNLMSNVGLQYSEPIKDEFGRSIYEVTVPKGLEQRWIDRFKKNDLVYNATLRKIR